MHHRIYILTVYKSQCDLYSHINKININKTKVSKYVKKYKIEIRKYRHEQNM